MFASSNANCREGSHRRREPVKGLARKCLFNVGPTLNQQYVIILWLLQGYVGSNTKLLNTFHVILLEMSILLIKVIKTQ